MSVRPSKADIKFVESPCCGTYGIGDKFTPRKCQHDLASRIGFIADDSGQQRRIAKLIRYYYVRRKR